MYVRADGDDSNDGLSTTTAKATPQGAWDDMFRNYDFRGAAVKMDIGGGNFVAESGAVLATSKPLIGASNLYIDGAGSGQTTLIGGSGIRPLLLHGFPGIITCNLRGIKVKAANNICISISKTNALVIFVDDIICDSTGNSQIINTSDVRLMINGSLVIQGSGHAALYVTETSELHVGESAIISSSSLSVSSAYAVCTRSSLFSVPPGATITGNVTGRRYLVSHLATISTSGAGANRIPGSIAGTADAATGGYYG
jgi:hypothetical protein